MRVRYTKHALERMRSRGIAKSEIRTALKHGQKHTVAEGLTKCVYKATKRTIVVVYNLKGVSDLEIITTYSL